MFSMCKILDGGLLSLLVVNIMRRQGQVAMYVPYKEY